MPMRWPRQQVRKVFSARTPRSSGAPTRLRACAGGGELRKGYRRGALRQRSLAVDRLAHGVDDAAEPGRPTAAPAPAALAITARQPRRTPSRLPNGISTALAPAKPITSQGMIAVRAGLDHDPRADRHRVDRSGDLDHQAAHAHNAAINVDGIEVGDLLGERLHCENLKFPRIAAAPLTPCLPASLIIASLSLMTERLVAFRTKVRVGQSRLTPTLKVEPEEERIRKTGLPQYLSAIREKLTLKTSCARESGFVNHL